MITTESFIEKARKIHGTLYDYTDVVYINMHRKVKIIDPEYGEFWQQAQGHLSGQGHPLRGRKKQGDKKRFSLDYFLQRAKEKHGDLYDYSKVVYEHCDKKVCIIDPKYGEFWQSPYQHLNTHGCPERTKNKEWLIHKDHVIPMAICSQSRKSAEWVSARPLYKLLNSEINLKDIDAKLNREKSHTILVRGKEIKAADVRNNYDVILYLFKTIHGVDVSDIIEADKIYVNNFLFL